MRISSVITAAIGVALFASTANAESSLKPLPANALTTARTEILAMPEPELRSLMNYLAECGDRSSSPSAIRACSSALDRYKMEFGNPSHAVDQVIDSSENLQKVRRLITGGIAPGTAENDAALRGAVSEALASKRK